LIGVETLGLLISARASAETDALQNIFNNTVGEYNEKNNRCTFIGTVDGSGLDV